MLSNPKQRRRDVLTFRHFTRKGYALFACLGREVRIGVLSVATLASATPRLAAQTLQEAEGGKGRITTEASDTLALDEAVVSASRAPLAATAAARPVLTIGREEIAAAPGITCVNDLLKLAAGVDVRQRGGFGIQSDVSINGGTFDQITLLINGIPVSNPQTGHNAADFPINLSDIERVEILEGAASRVFGSQAFGGAINIVTRQGGDRLYLRAAGGSYGTAEAEARSAWTPGRFATSVSGRYQRSDGAVRNGEFQGGKVFWQGRYDDEAVRVDVQAGATANDFGANTFYSGAYPDQWEATRRYLISVAAETKGRVHVSPTLSWLRSTDHYQLVRHTPTGENFHRGDVFTGGVNAWTQWALGRTAAGVEMREEAIYSTNLGRPLAENQLLPIRGEDGRHYTCHDDRTNLSYFLEHNVLLRRWTLSVGVMAERNSAIDHRFRFYPGVDLSYRPADGWRLFASWNKSLRLPTFTDLYYKSPTQEGNVGLKPEECSAFRVGADFRTAAVTASVSAYYNRGTNMIDWVMYSPEDIYHSTNFQLDNMGVNLQTALDLQRCLGTRQPLTRLTAAYAYIHQHRRAGEPYYKSNYALEYLRHKFTATLAHRIAGRLSAEWTLRVQDREGAYLLYRDGQNTGELRPYGAHALLDCKLQWKARHYELFADLGNLTSHRYYDLANVLQPGFTVMAGAAVRW